MIKKYIIDGMHCASCASMIELDLEDAGIKAKCSYPSSSIEVDEKTDFDKIKKIVEKSGYSVNKL